MEVKIRSLSFQSSDKINGDSCSVNFKEMINHYFDNYSEQSFSIKCIPISHFTIFSLIREF